MNQHEHALVPVPSGDHAKRLIALISTLTGSCSLQGQSRTAPLANNIPMQESAVAKATVTGLRRDEVECDAMNKHCTLSFEIRQFQGLLLLRSILDRAGLSLHLSSSSQLQQNQTQGRVNGQSMHLSRARRTVPGSRARVQLVHSRAFIIRRSRSIYDGVPPTTLQI